MLCCAATSALAFSLIPHTSQHDRTLLTDKYHTSNLAVSVLLEGFLTAMQDIDSEERAKVHCNMRHELCFLCPTPLTIPPTAGQGMGGD